jgi:hypothetical protein
VLSGERRAAALIIAQAVAARASDPESIAQATAAASRQTRFPESLQREPYGVASGDAGLAVMCSYLDACMPRKGWDTVAHGFVTAAAQSAEGKPPLRPSLFSGLSGLAFAVESLSRDGTRYKNLLTTLDDGLAPAARALGATVGARDQRVAINDFDVISGASGVGAYLLRRDPHAALPEILAGLVSLAEMDEGAPRWATPPEQLEDELTARAYPSGNLNCGLAHGIPGPLALLALARRAGWDVPGQRDAIRRLADWLVLHRADDEWGVNWPSAVPLSPSGEPVRDLSALVPGRAAWCYGAPGVARALWLAGDALDDEELCDLAVEAIVAVLRRPVARRHIDSPTFCHGVAGLLQIVLRFANDTGLAVLADGANQLVDQLLAAYEPERPLGYASLEPGPNPVDRSGLLDGAAGVALVLLAAATDTEPRWDRLFLLS